MKAFKKDIANIDRLYEGRKPFYGELHDHSAAFQRLFLMLLALSSLSCVSKAADG